jgi:hypothetical protein
VEGFAVNIGIICRIFAAISVFFCRMGKRMFAFAKIAADETEEHYKKDKLLLPPPVPPNLKKFKE